MCVCVSEERRLPSSYVLLYNLCIQILSSVEILLLLQYKSVMRIWKQNHQTTSIKSSIHISNWNDFQHNKETCSPRQRSNTFFSEALVEWFPTSDATEIDKLKKKKRNSMSVDYATNTWRKRIITHSWAQMRVWRNGVEWHNHQYQCDRKLMQFGKFKESKKGESQRRNN